MDRNTLIGLVLIGVLLFSYTWFNANQQREQNKLRTAAEQISVPANTQGGQGPFFENDSTPLRAEEESKQRLGEFLYGATQGSEKTFTVENEVARYTFSNKGGYIAAVEQKQFKTFGGDPLMLFTPEGTLFDVSFFIKHGYNFAQINTADYFFSDPIFSTLQLENGIEAQRVSMTLQVDSAAFVEYLYTIRPNDYMIDFDLRFEGMEDMLATNQTEFDITWKKIAPQTERGYVNEKNNSSGVYHFPGASGIETVSLSKDLEMEDVNAKVKWVGFRKQFFSSIFIAQNNFSNVQVGNMLMPENSHNIAKFQANFSVPVSSESSEYKFNFYFGPNKFSLLRQYDLRLERLVPLGSWIVGWINRLIVIPVFDFLGKYISNYGIIIIILALLIKLLTWPLTYKSYMSSAKMRLLKPEIDKINEKYPKKEDAIKKQQATMALYKSAGANPMGGCLPMLIQLPILIAMFRFFPASIELRGERFLWAQDLSSYDSILQLPFTIPLYGNHVSLFALLMAVAMFITSKMTYNQTAATSNQQMPGMKFMSLYMGPLIMLMWFNSYASGLSCYYLFFNIFTIIQTLIFFYVINEDKLHMQMKENQKKPAKPKSKWQQRYDDMVKMQQQQQAGAKKK